MSDRTAPQANHLADTATGLPLRFEPTCVSVDEERISRKRKLAAAVRIFAKYGFAEGVSGHISVRDPGEPNAFWVNPFGVAFSRVKVSDLICVDSKGLVVEGKHPVNPSAFVIHNEVHNLGFDGVAHAHTQNSRALGAIGKLLEPVDQESAAFYGRQELFTHYGGPTTAREDGRAVAEQLGESRAMVLQYHGLLTVGRSLEEAVHWFLSYEKCAELQLQARAAGQLVPMSSEQACLARDGFGDEDLARFTFQLLWEEVLHEQPDFLDE